jgi:hypothetical protein
MHEDLITLNFFLPSSSQKNHISTQPLSGREKEAVISIGFPPSALQLKKSRTACTSTVRPEPQGR